MPAGGVIAWDPFDGDDAGLLGVKSGPNSLPMGVGVMEKTLYSSYTAIVMYIIQKYLFLTGRTLLALYFIFPGVMKVMNFAGTANYMATHGMMFIPFFLVLTIVIQIGGGLCLALGSCANPGICFGRPGAGH